MQVGPLPLSDSSVVLPLEFCYNSNRNYIVYPLADQTRLIAWAKSFSAKVIDILEELLGDVSNLLRAVIYHQLTTLFRIKIRTMLKK
jgi:hypothetical protein